MWGLSSTTTNSMHNSIDPPEMEINPPKTAFCFSVALFPQNPGLGILADVNVLSLSPSLGVLAGVNVLSHSPSLGVLAGVNVLSHSRSPGVLAGVNGS